MRRRCRRSKPESRVWRWRGRIRIPVVMDRWFPVPPISPTDCNVGRTPTPSISTASRKSHAATLAAIPTAPGPRWADGRTTSAAASTYGRVYEKVARARLGCAHWRYLPRSRAERHGASRAEAWQSGRRGVARNPRAIDPHLPSDLHAHDVRDFDAPRCRDAPRASLSPITLAYARSGYGKFTRSRFPMSRL